MPVPSSDARVINSVFISKRSMVCGIPFVYMALAYEYVEYAEYAENNSETSDTDEDENLNTRNSLLEVLAMSCSSPTEPAGLGGVQGDFVVTLLLDILYLSMEL